MAQPNNVSMSIEHLAKLVDEMWYLAGDKSADVR
jgi:ubiquinone biosynthesis protein COQ9